MKCIFSIFLATLAFNSVVSQKKDKTETSETTKKKLLVELSDEVCKCIDSISTNNTQKGIAADIHRCIDARATTFQLGAKLLDVDLSANKSTVEVATDFDSDEYKKYYYDMERYLMEHCVSIKKVVNASDLRDAKSAPKSDIAAKSYNAGLDAAAKEDYKTALAHFQNAVKEDPGYAFAWDNIGVCYRKMNDYPNAIASYEKSLSINPNGLMPLQNIAIVYIYQKEYQKAIDAYKKLAVISPENPEVPYGIGQTYALHMNEYEKGLDYLCQAYVQYVKMKSPYRTDAEKVIQYIYTKMKDNGTEDKFLATLKKYHMSDK